MVLLMFLRLFLQLQLTWKFGPVIRVLQVMMGDLLVFLVLWTMLILSFSATGVMVFDELPAYQSFADVFFMLSETSLGSWNFNIYQDYRNGPIYGELFHIFFIIVNMILVLNLIIAILADTYSTFQEHRLGLYYDQVLSRIPVYKNDNRYGVLITTVPPFNILCLFVIPIFYAIKNEDTIAKINQKLQVVGYLPIAIIYGIKFAVSNILMLPFAYIAAIVKKVKVIVWRNRFV
jgi:hypothetical protein